MQDQPEDFDLHLYLTIQKQWSSKTFGPHKRTKGVTDHIEKELAEVRENPEDLSEWIDIVILAFDGAWRQGFTPEEICAKLEEKARINHARDWPDWRTMGDVAIEHDRSKS